MYGSSTTASSRELKPVTVMHDFRQLVILGFRGKKLNFKDILNFSQITCYYRLLKILIKVSYVLTEGFC